MGSLCLERCEDTPLRLLSLDGGGVRGLSSLMVLRNLLDTIELEEAQLEQQPQHEYMPCDPFDLVCGTSIGGIIATESARLRCHLRSMPKDDVYMHQFDMFHMETSPDNANGRSRNESFVNDSDWLFPSNLSSGLHEVRNASNLCAECGDERFQPESFQARRHKRCCECEHDRAMEEDFSCVNDESFLNRDPTSTLTTEHSRPEPACCDHTLHPDWVDV